MGKRKKRNRKRKVENDIIHHLHPLDRRHLMMMMIIIEQNNIRRKSIENEKKMTILLVAMTVYHHLLHLPEKSLRSERKIMINIVLARFLVRPVIDNSTIHISYKIRPFTNQRKMNI